MDTFDRMLDKGFITSSCDFCCNTCEYVLTTIEPFSIYRNATTNVINFSEYECCINLYAAVEEYLNFTEAVGITLPLSNSSQSLLTSSLIQHGNNDSTCKLESSCCNNFNQCILDLGCNNNCFTADVIGLILDKGIAEKIGYNQESKICQLIEFLRTTKVNIIECIADAFLRILDKGIVISCKNGKLFVSSVEVSLIEKGLI
jgi:hypothetical protein